MCLSIISVDSPIIDNIVVIDNTVTENELYVNLLWGMCKESTIDYILQAIDMQRKYFIEHGCNKVMQTRECVATLVKILYIMRATTKPDGPRP